MFDIPDKYIPHTVVAITGLAIVIMWCAAESATGATIKAYDMSCPQGYVEVPVRMGIYVGSTCAPAIHSYALQSAEPPMPTPFTTNFPAPTQELKQKYADLVNEWNPGQQFTAESLDSLDPGVRDQVIDFAMTRNNERWLEQREEKKEDGKIYE